MSNRVVDIVERCLRETFCMTSGCEQTALAILAALEKEGYKVVAREPTEEMVKAMHAALYRWREAQGDPQQDPTNSQKHTIRFAYAHDAAPRYGEPSG